MINFWINSNSGDYVIESDGMYRLFLIARYHDPIVGCGVYMPPEIIEITQKSILMKTMISPVLKFAGCESPDK